MINEYNDATHGNWVSCDNGIIELEITVKNKEAKEKFLEFWNTAYENTKYGYGNYRNGILKHYKDDNFEGKLCSINSKYLDRFILSLEAISDEIKSNYGIPIITW